MFSIVNGCPHSRLKAAFGLKSRGCLATPRNQLHSAMTTKANGGDAYSFVSGRGSEECLTLWNVDVQSIAGKETAEH